MDALTLETESPEVPAHPDEPSEVENPPAAERPVTPEGRPTSPTGSRSRGEPASGGG